MLHRRQLHALGVNDKQIARRERNGVLHELYLHVFAVGHRNVSPLGHLIAALLSCGPDSCLSHRTAAAVLELRPINVRAIEVTVVAKCTPLRPGLIVHRTSRDPGPGEIRTRGPLRFSSFVRMMVEVAARETRSELERLITLAARRGLLDPVAMEAALPGYARWPGVGRLKEALGDYRPGPDRKSELERAFDRWLQRHPEIPEPLRNVSVDGWEIDCWWPEQRLALELDGRPYHVTVRDMERDRVKDTKLQRIGIRPMRVSDSRFQYDAAGVRDDLLALLALG